MQFFDRNTRHKTTEKKQRCVLICKSTLIPSAHFHYFALRMTRRLTSKSFFFKRTRDSSFLAISFVIVISELELSKNTSSSYSMHPCNQVCIKTQFLHLHK